MAILKTYTISTDVTGGAVNSGLLHSELLAAGDITNYTGINISGDSLEVCGDSFITEANVDASVLNHIIEPLANLKARRYGEIDLRTGQLIGAGFTYDSAQFSLSANAQLNWSEIHSNVSAFSDPVEVATIDNNVYDLTHANVDAFWTAALNATKGHLDSGRALKKSVFDAADKAAVDAVVDNR